MEIFELPYTKYTKSFKTYVEILLNFLIQNIQNRLKHYAEISFLSYGCSLETWKTLGRI